MDTTMPRNAEDPAQGRVHDRLKEEKNQHQSSADGGHRPGFSAWVMAHRERFLSLAGEMSSDGDWPTDIRTLDDLNAYLDAWPAIEPVKRDARLAMAEYVKEVV